MRQTAGRALGGRSVPRVMLALRPTAPSQPMEPQGPPARDAVPGERQGVRASRVAAHPPCSHLAHVSSGHMSSAMVALPTMCVKSVNQYATE